jgi:hypothetical protein
MSLLREIQCNVLDSSSVENKETISTGQIETSNGGVTLSNPGPAAAPAYSPVLVANLDVNNKGELVVSGDNIVNLNAYSIAGITQATIPNTPALVVNVVSGGITGKYYLPLWSID